MEPTLLLNGQAPSKTWKYFLKGAVPAFAIARYETTDGKDIRPWRPLGAGRWELGMPDMAPGSRPLFAWKTFPTQADGKMVVVVEGEKTVEALYHLGIIATTSSGGAVAAHLSNWGPLALHSDICIIPDNDAPGEKYAADVVELLREYGTDNQTIRIARLPGLPAKGDAVDWLSERLPGWNGLTPIGQDVRDHLREELLAAIEDCAVPAETTPIIEADEWPIDDEAVNKDAVPFPVDALGPILAPAARVLERDVQLPVEVVALSLLSASALAVQHLADVGMPDGRRILTSLFALSVLGSGERKSACDRIVLSPHREWMHQALEDHSRDMEDWHNEHDAWDAARGEARSKSKKHGRAAIRTALDDVGPEPLRPPAPTLILGNLTIEGLQKSLAQDWPSVGVFSDDAGSIVGGFSMNRENKVKTISEFSQLWDGSSCIRVRAGDGTSLLFGRRVSMHWMMQPDIARLLMAAELVWSQGVLARFLMVSPESKRGERPYRRSNPTQAGEMQRYHATVRSILSAPIEMDPATHEIKPRLVPLSSDAMNAYIAFHDAVERENSTGGPLDSVSPWASKAAEHAVRLAGVLELLDNPAALEVTADNMVRGCSLAAYFLDACLRLRSSSSVSTETLRTMRLMGWIKDRGQAEVSSREIQQYSFMRDMDEIDAAMDLAERNGWAARMIPKITGQGRPPKKWRINPNAA